MYFVVHGRNPHPHIYFAVLSFLVGIVVMTGEDPRKTFLYKMDIFREVRLNYLSVEEQIFDE